MYHSIKFNNKDCYAEWGLIPNGRPHVVPPSVRTNVIELPGGNGNIDLTTSLTGYPLYGNREGSFEFLITRKDKNYNWVSLQNELSKTFHGKQLKIILEDDPGYYYIGRCSLGEWTEGRPYDTVTLDYVLEPYKRNCKDNLEQYPNVEWIKTVNSGFTGEFSDLSMYLEDAPINPIIKIENTSDIAGTVGLTFRNDELKINVETRLPVGTQRCPLFTMTNFTGSNVVKLSVNDPCKITLNYRNGRL